MADDSMDITSEFGQNIGEDDIDIELDLMHDHQDEDLMLEDTRTDDAMEEEFEPQQVPIEEDDIMIEDDTASFQMNDAELIDGREIHELHSEDVVLHEQDATAQVEEENPLAYPPPWLPFNDAASLNVPQVEDLQGEDRVGGIPEDHLDYHAEHDSENVSEVQPELQSEQQSEMQRENESEGQAETQSEPQAENQTETASRKENDNNEGPTVEIAARSGPNTDPDYAEANPTATTSTGSQEGDGEIVTIQGFSSINGKTSTSKIEASGIQDFADDHNKDESGSLKYTNVIVAYQGAEYALVSRMDSDDPDSYFFKDDTVLRFPIPRFFEGLRGVLGDDLTNDDELCLVVNDLGLEFTETCRSIDDITFSQIIDLHIKLQENDSISEFVPLYITLSAKAEFSRRFHVLSQNAVEGMGLSECSSWGNDSEAVEDGNDSALLKGDSLEVENNAANDGGGDDVYNEHQYGEDNGEDHSGNNSGHNSHDDGNVEAVIDDHAEAEASVTRQAGGVDNIANDGGIPDVHEEWTSPTTEATVQSLNANGEQIESEVEAKAKPEVDDSYKIQPEGNVLDLVGTEHESSQAADVNETHDGDEEDDLIDYSDEEADEAPSSIGAAEPGAEGTSQDGGDGEDHDDIPGLDDPHETEVVDNNTRNISHVRPVAGGETLHGQEDGEVEPTKTAPLVTEAVNSPEPNIDESHDSLENDIDYLIDEPHTTDADLIVYEDDISTEAVRQEEDLAQASANSTVNIPDDQIDEIDYEDEDDDKTPDEVNATLQSSPGQSGKRVRQDVDLDINENGKVSKRQRS